jgi:hypothetical protein
MADYLAVLMDVLRDLVKAASRVKYWADALARLMAQPMAGLSAKLRAQSMAAAKGLRMAVGLDEKMVRLKANNSAVR